MCIESERSRFAQNLNRFGLAIPGSSATCAHFYWSHALAVTFIHVIIKIPKGPEHVGSRRGQQLQISPLLQEVCYWGLTRGGAAWCWPASHLWSHPAGSGLCACPSDWWRVTLRYSTAQASVDSWETNFVEFKTSSSKGVKSKVGQERREKYIWTARQVNLDLTSRFGCYWCSSLFNCNRYSCTGAFFDLIEWLKDYFLDLYLYLIFECQLFLGSG